jgi:membrane-associated phospholipid phosphatase
MYNLFSSLDRSILFWFNDLIKESYWFKVFVFAMARFGILIFVFALVYLFFRKDTSDHDGFLGLGYHKNRQIAFYALISLVVGFAVDEIISLFFPRPRPFVTYPDLIKQLNVTVDLVSFPSKHAIATFAMGASVYFSGHRNLGIFLFVCAALVAISRVAAGVHYPSDVLAGAILGVGSAYFVYSQRDWIRRHLLKEEK